jgi:hypothetical protein
MPAPSWKSWYWIILIVTGWLLANYLLGGSYLWQCPILKITGLKCTGCGGQRAILELFQGNLGQAIYYNALMPLTLLVGIIWSLQYLGISLFKKIWKTMSHKAVWLGLLILVVLFTIIRNTSIWAWY